MAPRPGILTLRFDPRWGNVSSPPPHTIIDLWSGPWHAKLNGLCRVRRCANWHPVKWIAHRSRPEGHREMGINHHCISFIANCVSYIDGFVTSKKHSLNSFICLPNMWRQQQTVDWLQVTPIVSRMLRVTMLTTATQRSSSHLSPGCLINAHNSSRPPSLSKSAQRPLSPSSALASYRTGAGISGPHLSTLPSPPQWAGGSDFSLPDRWQTHLINHCQLHWGAHHDLLPPAGGSPCGSEAIRLISVQQVWLTACNHQPTSPYQDPRVKTTVTTE